MFTKETREDVLCDELKRMRLHLGSYPKICMMAGGRFKDNKRQTIYSWIKRLKANQISTKQREVIATFLNTVRKNIGLPDYNSEENSDEIYLTMRTSKKVQSDPTKEKKPDFSSTTLTPEDVDFLYKMLELSSKEITFHDAYILLCTCRGRIS